MRLRVLGCSGSPQPGHFSSSFLLNDDLLLDAGSAASRLSSEEKRRLACVLISHMHIDHTKELGFLPFARDSAADRPLLVAAPSEIVSAVKHFIFNPEVWFDLASPSDGSLPRLGYTTLDEGVTFHFEGYEILAIRMAHPVPTFGYIVRSQGVSLAYSSDTGPDTRFWEFCQSLAVQNIVLECSLPNARVSKAKSDGHLTPALIEQIISTHDLANSHLFIYHLKPNSREEIVRELGLLELSNLCVLEDGSSYEL